LATKTDKTTENEVFWTHKTLVGVEKNTMEGGTLPKLLWVQDIKDDLQISESMWDILLMIKLSSEGLSRELN
jgi:hypothetical protein